MDSLWALGILRGKEEVSLLLEHIVAQEMIDGHHPNSMFEAVKTIVGEVFDASPNYVWSDGKHDALICDTATVSMRAITAANSDEIKKQLVPTCQRMLECMENEISNDANASGYCSGDFEYCRKSMMFTFKIILFIDSTGEGPRQEPQGYKCIIL